LNMLRRLPGILLGVLFVLFGATDLHAAKQIGVIMTGDVPYYREMHDSFVAEIHKRLAGEEKIEIILQRPFPNAVSWSNAARKLIAFDVDLIVSYGSPATQAVLHEKSRIPLIYAGVYEPDRADVAGRNVTGCGFKVPLSSIIRYLKGLKPLNTIGILFSSVEEDSARQNAAMRALAAQQNIKVESTDIRSRTDLGRLQETNADVVFITGSSLVHLWINDILSVLKKKQLPAADIFSDDAESGMLMTLHHPPHVQGQMAGEMASRILLGAHPGSIAPHIFRETELVLNLAEARRMGVIFPIHLLVEASKVRQ